MAINLAAIMKQWQDSMNQTNAANEARYQDILGTYGDTGGVSIMDLVSQLGQTDLRNVDISEAQAKAKAQQSLISRGLGNTTARAGEMRNISNMAEMARQEVGESQLEKQMNVLGAKAQMMGNRTDQGPNAGLFASLMQAAANQATTTGVDPQTGRQTGLGGGYSSIGSVNEVNSRLDAWANSGLSGRSSGGGGGGGGGTSVYNTAPVTGSRSSSEMRYGGKTYYEAVHGLPAGTEAARAAQKSGSISIAPSGSLAAEAQRQQIAATGQNLPQMASSPDAPVTAEGLQALLRHLAQATQSYY
jgi:hypothetical protein